MIDLSSRVTIIAVGINKYQDRNLRNLKGAHKDIDKLRNLLTKNSKTAIYNPKQFIELKDPDSKEFREKNQRVCFGQICGRRYFNIIFFWSWGCSRQR